MNTQITHTTTRRGGLWQPSMSALGSVTSDRIVIVRWNDDAETSLRVLEDGQAEAWHLGKRYDLKYVAGDIDTVVNYWTVRIQKRLEAKRLEDRVKGGIQLSDAGELIRQWNVDRAA